MNHDTFSGFHPVVNLCFFGVAIGLTMCLMHPVFLLISLSASCIYFCHLQSARAFMRRVGYLIPVLLITAAMNPLFNPQGQTVLFSLGNGDPVTLESLCYGLCASALMGASIIWFNCSSVVFTTDKIICLFGRLVPSLSLLISMTLRFVPRFKDYLQASVQVQRSMRAPRNRTEGLKQALTAFSATVSWAMEQSIVTADSMKSRGYGAANRTAYAVFRFEKRDAIALAVLAALALGTALPWVAGWVEWSFFPAMTGARWNPGAVASGLCFTGICLMPLTIDLTEDCKWNSLRSKI